MPGGGVGIATARAGQALKQTDTVDGPGPILPHYSPDVALAVDDEGGATVAWVTTPVALVATRRPGERFGVAQELGDVAAFDIALAVNPAGAAVVAWGIGSQSVRARYRLAGETRFGREEKIPRASDMGGAPLARIKDDGTAIVASSIRAPFGFSGGVSYSERAPLVRGGGRIQPAGPARRGVDPAVHVWLDARQRDPRSPARRGGRSLRARHHPDVSRPVPQGRGKPQRRGDRDVEGGPAPGHADGLGGL